ncbi:MAG: nucleotidyltransferase family protein [Planctomycetia bacterium]|nr:nucleotidyltransferase family protein [Planctomycetia bacterium]
MDDLQSIDAVVLVGGLGTRLRSVVADRPKPLALVAGRPFLCAILDQFAEAGLRRVALCAGYCGEMVAAELGNTYGPLELRHTCESQPLGTAGAVCAALPHLESSTLLVANGDSYCEADLPAFLRFHRGRNAAVSLLLTRVADTCRFGQVQCDAAGRVLCFTEKGGHRGPGWINAGIYLIERSFVESWPRTAPLSLERDVFPSLLVSSWGGLWAFAEGGRFLDIGTLESYRASEAFLAALGRGAASRTPSPVSGRCECAAGSTSRKR